MKVGVVGSRNYRRPDLIPVVLGRLLTDADTVVSGGARGVDTWGEEFARSRGIPVEIYYPDWHTFGRAAGMLRNTSIIEASDIVVAFWDGLSSGTLDSIKKAEEKQKPVLVVFPSGRVKRNTYWSRPGNGAQLVSKTGVTQTR